MFSSSCVALLSLTVLSSEQLVIRAAVIWATVEGLLWNASCTRAPLFVFIWVEPFLQCSFGSHTADGELNDLLSHPTSCQLGPKLGTGPKRRRCCCASSIRRSFRGWQKNVQTASMSGKTRWGWMECQSCNLSPGLCLFPAELWQEKYIYSKIRTIPKTWLIRCDIHQEDVLPPYRVVNVWQWAWLTGAHTLQETEFVPLFTWHQHPECVIWPAETYNKQSVIILWLRYIV